MKFNIWDFLWKYVDFRSNLVKITGILNDVEYTFVIISRWIFLGMRTVSDKSCRENENSNFMLSNLLFPKIVPLEPDRTEYDACALHAGYLRLQTQHRICNTHWFLSEKWLRERISMLLYTYMVWIIEDCQIDTYLLTHSLTHSLHTAQSSLRS
jgi:hypothetical protein